MAEVIQKKEAIELTLSKEKHLEKIKSVKEFKLNEYFNFDSLKEKTTLTKMDQDKLNSIVDLMINVLEKGKGGITLFHEAVATEVKNIDKKINEKKIEILKAIRPLEQTCSYLSSFFANTNIENSQFPGKVAVIHASKNDLENKDGVTIDAVKNVLKKHFDRFIKTESFGYVIVPDLGKDPTLFKKWHSVTNDTKSILITDFKNLEECDSMNTHKYGMKDFTKLDPNPSNDETYKGTEMERGVILFNWLVYREPQMEGDTKLVIPPSAAFGALFSSAPISRITAGFDKGRLIGVPGVTHDLMKSEIQKVNDFQLIPIMQESKGQSPTAFGINGLYNGTTVYYQKLPYVKAHDWISMNIENCLNNNTFVLLDERTKREIRDTIQSFLNIYTGDGNLYVSATVDRIVTDAEDDKTETNDPLKINAYITLQPKIIGERFSIKLDGVLGGAPKQKKG